MGTELNATLVGLIKRRQIILWRIVALVAVCGACLLVLPGRRQQAAVRLLHKPHIARLVVSGVIGNDVSRTVRALRDAQKSPDVTGLLVVVDSPGGGVTGGERLHDALVRFAAVKPVVVSMGDMGASAAYMLSVAAQHIVALPSTLTGSIGVIMQRPDVSVGLGKLGIGVAAITSGSMKDQTDPTSTLTPEGRQMLQGLVDDLFGQFVAMVAAGRHLTEDKVRSLADGRAYTGRQALALGLVDELGDEDVARQWLRQKLDLGNRPYPVLPLIQKKTWNWQSVTVRKAEFGASISDVVGGVAQAFVQRAIVGIESRPPLDGAVAILQP